MEGGTLSDPEWRDAYRRAVIDVVQITKPLYLSLGNKVNIWYEEHGAEEGDPQGFQNYVSLYHTIYDAVKGISPETSVFCTFAREVVAENREADLTILNLFNPEKLDLLVFTSYSHALQGINNPRDIPDYYYSRILDEFPEKSLGFSEITWPSLEAFGGETAQSAFITLVTTRLTREEGVDLQLLGWPWLHDMDESDHI
jgi:hypothetical protein